MNIKTIEITFNNEDSVTFNNIIQVYKEDNNFYCVYYGDSENRFREFINLKEVRSIWIKYE